jgi:hypothetical protein
MKYTLIFFFLLGLTSVRAQNPTKHFELGPTVVTVNSSFGHIFSRPDAALVEYLNGLFCRYTKGRVGVRGFISYSQFRTEGASTFASERYTEEGSAEQYQDLTIGTGAQYSLSKKNQWLYAFVDIAYNTKHSSGSGSGDLIKNERFFMATKRGLDSYLGLGIKLNALKCLVLSPELSFNLFCGSKSSEITSLRTGETNNYTYSFNSGRPILKLHLTYLF